ncbi:MAG TPA: MFS transporter [Xanthobacteraceae bacterium]|nr:MFS transporter [Xanthobacteraceae bacterium]
MPPDRSPAAATAVLAPEANRHLFFSVFPSIMLPMFLAVVDQTIVATALPAIAATVGQIGRASWVVIAYLISATVAAPVYGQLGDVFGRKRMMFIALAVFMSASILCAASQSIEMLTAARIVQGLGGGGLMTLSQALIGETIPPRERGRYQGYLAGVMVTSSAFGPVAGGFLTHYFGWRSVFLVNLPIGVIAVFLTTRLTPHSGERGQWRFDTPGLVWFVLFVAPILLALDQAQRWEPRALFTILGLVGLSIASLGLLLHQENRAHTPLLPVSLLRQAAIWRSDGLAACHGGALVSMITFLPIYLQAVRGLSPQQTGLLLLPLTAGIGVGSMITGRIVTRTGLTTIFPTWGLAVVTLNLVLFALLASRLPTVYLPWVFGWNALFMGTVMGVVQVTVQAVAGPKMLGAGAASVQFSRSVGAAVGTAIVAAVLFSVLGATDPETARLFGRMVERGPAAVAALEPARHALVQAEIAYAFRAAFLAIAAFTGVGLLLAWSIPVRRI